MPNRNRWIAAAALFLSLLAPRVNADEGVGPEEQTVAVEETAAALPKAEPPKVSVALQTGTASWYGGSFVGRKTASGERYVISERTAAHRTLPFGTLVRVTNLRNQKSAVVRVNNRGPFIKTRIIDLSKQAAADLGMLKAGTARVQLEVLSKDVALAELGRPVPES